MKVFTRDEIELLRLEASRTRIAKVREKLREMKKMATLRLGRTPFAAGPGANEDRDKSNE